MANYANLISAIRTAVNWDNNNNEISGNDILTILLSIINNTVVAGYQFIGIATPSTNPGTPDQRVFYIGGAGTYPNFGAAVIPIGNLAVFYYDSSWHYDSIVFPLGDGAVSESKLATTLVNKLFADGYKFAGVATSQTNPGTPDQNVFYFAFEVGAYTNFSGLTVSGNNIAIFYYNGTWHKEEFDCSRFMGFSKMYAKSFYNDVGYIGNNLVLGGDFIGEHFIDYIGNIIKAPGSILCRIPVVPGRRYYIKSKEYHPYNVGALGYSQNPVDYGAVSNVSMESLSVENGYKVFDAPNNANYLYINTYLVLAGGTIVDVRDLVVYDTTVTDVTGLFPTTYVERRLLKILNSLKLQGGNYVEIGDQLPDIVMDYVGHIWDSPGSILCRVPVSPNKTYYIKSTEYSSYVVGALGYSAAPVSSGTLAYAEMQNLPEQSGYRVFVVPAGMNYVYFNLYLAGTADVRDFYFSDTINGYVASEADREILEMISPATNKKIVFLGDSLTHLAIVEPTKGWVTYFLQNFSFSEYTNYARSGATWSNTPNTTYDITENTGNISDDNVIYNQVNRLLNDINNGGTVPDYIIIAAGTNDAWFPSERPNTLADTAKIIFEDTATNYIDNVNINTCVSIAKAMRYVAEMIIRYLPNAQVIILTPLQSTGFTDERNNSISTVIKECANYMGWNVIEQSKECGISRLQEIRGFTKTYDGTHTSVDGAKFVGNILASIFKSIAK